MTTGYYVGDVDIGSIFNLNYSATFADTTGILLSNNTDLNLYFEPYPIGSGEPYASETGYISKTGNDISTIFRKIPPPHTFTSASIYATSAASGGTINNAALNVCQGICIDPSDNIYFCNGIDAAKSIYKINIITNTRTVLVPTNYNLGGHVSICIDKINNLHTVGYDDLTVTKITPAGVVSTLISSGGVGIAIDNSYNIFTSHARVIMYKYNGTGYDGPVYIAYAAGSGGTAYTSATNATLAINLKSPNNVSGLCINNGKLYISCIEGYVFYINLANVYDNNTNVLITKVAGNGSTTLPAQQDGVNVPSLDNIYICCNLGNRIVKVTPDNRMTTFIGPATGAVIVVPLLYRPFHACFNKTYDQMYFTCSIGSNGGLVYKVI